MGSLDQKPNNDKVNEIRARFATAHWLAMQRALETAINLSPGASMTDRVSAYRRSIRSEKEMYEIERELIEAMIEAKMPREDATTTALGSVLK